MRLLLTILIPLLIAGNVRAQNTDFLNEQQLEDLSESDEVEPEDEYDLQQLDHLKKNRLDLNDPSSALSEFPLLSPLLVDNILSYRKLLGKFIDLYELQAVPGFTKEIIQKILPYITVAVADGSSVKWPERLTAGDHSMLVRQAPSSKIYLRHKYQYRDLFQYGFVAEKDAGEKIIPDFFSFHIALRKIGVMKSLVIGDFTINLGQGLVHWQSQAFRKSSSVLNIKRQSEIIRPYHSAGEFNFSRGAAVTLRKNSLEAVVFVSYRKLTANVSEDDQFGEVVTSIITSGLHRTPQELAKKNRLRLLTTGGALKYQNGSSHLGLNLVNYMYSIPILKRDELYNVFAFRGTRWFNMSVDYSFTFRHAHFFGEAAVDRHSGVAVVNGILTSLGPAVDFSILHRTIAKGYQSLYGNAFTENTAPSSEHGIYLGVSMQPAVGLKIDVYADVFSFPWLKYRVDAPARGYQQLVQLTWKPAKNIEMYTRFRLKSKPLNVQGPVSYHPVNRAQENWRSQINFRLNPFLEIRTRAESCRVDKPGAEAAGSGYLFFADAHIKPRSKDFSANIRFQFFESDDYDSRIYAYENDLPFSSSVPSFYDKGTRLYLNFRTGAKLNFSRSSALDIGFKLAFTTRQKREPVPVTSDRMELKSQIVLTL